MRGAVDNDVILKGACYGLLADLIQAIPCDLRDVGVLGAARFVIRRLLPRAAVSRDLGAVDQCLRDFFRQAEILEPTMEELRFAATLELTAQTMDVDLDVGESQLCAIVVARAAEWFATGDKRAVLALEKILLQLGQTAGMDGKVLCFEQLFLRLLAIANPAHVRQAVCSRLIPLSQVNQNLVLAGQIRNGAGFEFFGRS